MAQLCSWLSCGDCHKRTRTKHIIGNMPTLAAILILACGCRNTAFGTQPDTTPLSVEDALRTQSIDNEWPPALSPDGEWVAYVVSTNQNSARKTGNEETDLYARTGVVLSVRTCDVWISNTETGETRNLTEAKGTNWDPVWSGDGRYLAFLSTRGGEQARPWVWDSVEKHLSLIANVLVRESPLDIGIQWTPDSRRVIVTGVPEGMSADEYSRKVLLPTSTSPLNLSRTPGSTVTLYAPHHGSYAVDAASPMFNLDAQYLRDLMLLDIRTGNIKTILHGQRIGWHALSPDGSRVACAVTKGFDEPGSFQRVYDLVTVNLETINEQTVGSDILLDDAFAWSPDSAALAFGAYAHDKESYDYFVLPVTGSPLRKVATLPYHPHLDTGLSRLPLWDPDGKHLYFIEDGTLHRTSVTQEENSEVVRIPKRLITRRIARPANLLWVMDQGTATVVITHDAEGKQDGFYRANLLTGKSTKLLEAGQCYSCAVPSTLHSGAAISANGKTLVYIAEDAGHSPELWLTDSDFRRSRRLTHLNPQLDKYEMGSARVIDWLSDDGDTLRGALLLPSGYQPGRRYPLIVWVYPGTTLSDHFDHFAFGEFPGPFNMQLFATRGYAVLFPDARDKVGDRVGALEKSVLAGVSRVVEMGIADPARIGLMGHSQGGYATLALITHTSRFRAAVECSGWGDYVGLYGSMNKDGISFEYGQTERLLGEQPWQNPEKYVRNSPIFYLNRVTTPLLIVHGSSDATLSSSFAGEVFVGLRRLNKEVEYAEYRGESHAPADWSYANQLDVANRVLTWFDHHLNADVQQSSTGSSAAHSAFLGIP